MLPKILAVIGVIFLIFWFLHKIPSHKIRYVAIGDSYTYGQGATPGSTDWPTLLTKNLKAQGKDIVLLNLGHNNWTTQQAIDDELSIYRTYKPTFATLMIGANDWIQNVSTDTFRQRFSYLLDQMIAELPEKKSIIVVTIPDYDATPYGIGLGLKRTSPGTVLDFNKVIQEEATKRQVTVVDIYPASKKMREDSSLLSTDRLHPSAKEYAIWEQMIYPEADRILKTQ